MGRKPLPTAVKKAKGTAQNTRLLKDEYVPKVISSLPAPPDYFNEFAKKEYFTVGEKLMKDKVITTVDMTAFVAYCNEIGNYFEAQQELRDNGRVIKMKGSGYTAPSPWISISNQSYKNAMAMAVQFGLTPSARTKVAAPKDKDTNPIAQMVALHGKKGTKTA